MKKFKKQRDFEEEDDAIVATQTAAVTKKPGKRRELKKTNVDTGNKGQSLEEIIQIEGTGTFDQFKGRNTTYSED